MNLFKAVGSSQTLVGADESYSTDVGPFISHRTLGRELRSYGTRLIQCIVYITSAYITAAHFYFFLCPVEIQSGDLLHRKEYLCHDIVLAIKDRQQLIWPILVQSQYIED